MQCQGIFFRKLPNLWLNVQAACDNKYRFVYAAVAVPGGAFRKTGLSQMIQKLPLRKFVVGDNAYVCSETLLTHFLVLRKRIQRKMHLTFI